MTSPESPPSPRVVLVTGCASGVGLATAIRFAEAGDTVVATVRSLANSSQLAEALAATGGGSEVVELDVTGPDVERVVTGTVTRHGRLDVVVNNAGAALGGALEDVSVDDLRFAMDVNYLGTARVTRAALAHMRAAGGGHILAVSSIGGARGMSFNDGYVAAKHAVEGLFESVAPVVAMFGIKMTIVEAAGIRTTLLTKPGARMAEPSAPYAAMYAAFDALREQAFETASSAEDIARVIHAQTLLDDPPLRVQDTPTTTAMVGLKIADLDGRRIMKTSRLFEGLDITADRLG